MIGQDDDSAIKPMIQTYDEYYKCSNPRCESVYHTYNFRKKTFECKDCGTTSLTPEKPRKK